MKSPLVPCNSLIALDSPTPTNSDTPNRTPISSPPQPPKKQRFSESDLTIINNSMTVQRKKTLMCTEQSNFQVLQKIKLPEKKFGAACPTEYQKFMIQSLNIKTQMKESLRYEYPKESSTRDKRRGQSVTCSVF